VIYTYPEPTEPIRQGDLYQCVPRIQVILGSDYLPEILETVEGGSRAIEWMQFQQSEEPVLANVFIRSVTGIVITQDCDTLRAENIAMCEVRPFSSVEKWFTETTKPKKFLDIVTRHARVNQKWYYLPPDTRLGFIKKMGADFTSVFEVPREMLESHREDLRLGRLNDDVACPHFRERVAEFFRRYPYNEWYPLTKEETDLYESDKGCVERYSWQM